MIYPRAKHFRLRYTEGRALRLFTHAALHAKSSIAQHPLLLPQHHKRSCGTFSGMSIHICLLSLDRIAAGDSAAYVHLRMGFHASLAGLVISIQYIATFLSRPWAGRISDTVGAKVSVLWGMGACTASGVLLLGAAALDRNPAWLSLTILLASRLVLGVEKAWFYRRNTLGHHGCGTGQHRASDFV